MALLFLQTNREGLLLLLNFRLNGKWSFFEIVLKFLPDKTIMVFGFPPFQDFHLFGQVAR
jgi:hypothetical protein